MSMLDEDRGIRAAKLRREALDDAIAPLRRLVVADVIHTVEGMKRSQARPREGTAESVLLQERAATLDGVLDVLRKMLGDYYLDYDWDGNMSIRKKEDSDGRVG